MYSIFPSPNKGQRKSEDGEPCQNFFNLLKLGFTVKRITRETYGCAIDGEEALVKEGNAPFVALGSRLRGIPEVLTLGVRPNFHD